jgi:ribonuclease J
MLKIAFLGGLGDFGKNMTVFDQDGRLLVVDCGSMFPEADFPGIDLVFPDFTYLQDKAGRVEGLVLTHGHEDHLGAAPFLLRQFPMPVYGGPVTLGILGRKLEELEVTAPAQVTLQAGVTYDLGPFALEAVPVTHSIPDAFSLLIRTADATVLHTGDFKLDQTPLDGRLTHYHRFQEAGARGVTALLIDSTNVELEGMVGSEVRVRGTLERYIASQTGKLFITLFSSNLMRVQSILDLAAAHGKRVAFFGRSLVQNVKVGQETGYLRMPPGVEVGVEEVPDLPKSEVIVIASGSQAEPFAALNRLVFDESRHLYIEEGDLLIFSARIIPGNEKRVARVINQVYRNGGQAVTPREDRVHVSGHAAQEEIKLLASWVRPRYYVPIHGEYRQLKGNAALAKEMGYPDENTLVCDTGHCLHFEAGELVGREEVPTGSQLIDGDTADAVDRVVVRDRRHLSQDGVVVPIVVINRQTGRMESAPEIISRGYPYLEGANGTVEEVRADLVAMVRSLPQEEIRDDSIVKAKVKSTVKKTLKRNDAKIPLIIPVVMEI